MTSPAFSKLFSIVAIGRMVLTHRVVRVPTKVLLNEQITKPVDAIVDYFLERATPGGLIIVPFVDAPDGTRCVPEAARNGQAPTWKKVTDAVHSLGGRIYSQIGAIDLPSSPQKDGPRTPTAAEEMSDLVESFRESAKRALDDGFDGVELQAVPDSMIDALLQVDANVGATSHGGTDDNRARLPLEVLEALVSVFDSDRVGVRVSLDVRGGRVHGSDPAGIYSHFVDRLNEYELAYLHVAEPRRASVRDHDERRHSVATKYFRKIFDGPIIATGGFDRESAEALLRNSDADLVGFGRDFESNADLPDRLRSNKALRSNVCYSGAGSFANARAKPAQLPEVAP
jgi:N-ethylmaleimide reductase